MIKCTTRKILEEKIRELITQGKTFCYRKTNKLDGFNGWILFL